jgi:hypothetical protein
MALRTLECAVEQLADWHAQLFLEAHIVAAVAIMSRYLPSPAVFEVECVNVTSTWLGEAKHFTLKVTWLQETATRAERLLLTVQMKPLIEMAATTLALVLAYRVLDLGQLDVAMLTRMSGVHVRISSPVTVTALTIVP